MAGATILVVDDDSAMRTIVSLSLKLYGYVVLVAGSGELSKQRLRVRNSSFEIGGPVLPFTFVPC